MPKIFVVGAILIWLALAAVIASALVSSCIRRELEGDGLGLPDPPGVIRQGELMPVSSWDAREERPE